MAKTKQQKMNDKILNGKYAQTKCLLAGGGVGGGGG